MEADPNVMLVRKYFPEAKCEQGGRRYFIYRHDKYTGTGWASMGSGNTVEDAWQDAASYFTRDSIRGGTNG